MSAEKTVRTMASDDDKRFEEQLQRHIRNAVTASELSDVPAAFVIGYLMGAAKFDEDDRMSLHDRIFQFKRTMWAAKVGSSLANKNE